MAEWTAQYINDLPDSAFAFIEAGGDKDDSGRTTPRSLRHFPHHNAAGDLDLPHLRNALARGPQSDVWPGGQRHLEAHAVSAEIGDRKSAAELPARALKFVGPDTIEGPAFLFNPDLVGERFTPDTDLCIEWFGKSGRPLLYEHGLDDALKAGLIGRQTDYEQRAEGYWAQSELDKNARFRKAIDGLIEKGALAYSGGGMAHLATKSANGSLKRFPWVELSLTPTPMNPANDSVYYLKSAEALSHLEEVDIAIPDPLKAALTALDEWAESRDDDGLPDGLKFAEHADRLLADVTAFRDRAESISDLRAKSGRVLSASTRERLVRHPASLRELADDLDELLATADAAKASKSALWDAVIQAEMTQARYLGVPVPAGEPS